MNFSQVLSTMEGYFREQLKAGINVKGITNNLKTGTLPEELHLDNVTEEQIRRAGQIVASKYLNIEAQNRSKITSFN